MMELMWNHEGSTLSSSQSFHQSFHQKLLPSEAASIRAASIRSCFHQKLLLSELLPSEAASIRSFRTDVSCCCCLQVPLPSGAAAFSSIFIFIVTAMEELDVPQMRREVESLQYQLAINREKSSITVTELVKWIEGCVCEDPFLNPELMRANPWVEKGKCVIL
ncbi:uncharacterized protein V6R79_007111 [Siganus canaliculatus]